MLPLARWNERASIWGDTPADPPEPDDPWERAAADLVALYLPETGRALPESDRRRIYNRACKAYRQADKEPPEYRTARELAPLLIEHVAGLFLEGEPALFPADFHAEAIDTRAGAVISGRNMTDLEEAARLLAGVIERGRKAPPADMPMDEEDETPAERSAEPAGVDPALLKLHQIVTRSIP